MGRKSYSHKSITHKQLKRAKKYELKLDANVTALIYKVRAITFMPTDIKLQTVLDNLDSNIASILDGLGYSPLNRNNKAKFMQSMLPLMAKYQGLTLVNEINILKIKYNLSDDETKNIVNSVIGLLQSEGLIPIYDFP